MDDQASHNAHKEKKTKWNGYLESSHPKAPTNSSHSAHPSHSSYAIPTHAPKTTNGSKTITAQDMQTKYMNRNTAYEIGEEEVELVPERPLHGW